MGDIRETTAIWGGRNDTESRQTYGSGETYELGAAWLESCALVEDWGCGKGWLGTLIPPERYRAIDAASPFANVQADLADYRSKVEGVFMRHVLEHNFRWPQILGNALDSFTKRMVLVVFTPLVDETKEIKWHEPPGVPDIAFRLDDLTRPMDARGIRWTHQTLKTHTDYGVETVIYAER